MATGVNKLDAARASVLRRRYDRQFFMVMAILLTAVVAIGFAEMSPVCTNSSSINW